MKRNPVFDFLKFIAIFLVVLQHFMMRFGLDMGMMDVWPGKMIIMVNMPLFIFISGWFSASLHNKTFSHLLSSRYTSLVRPTIVYSILSAFVCGMILNNLPSGWGGYLEFIMHSIISSYWFIWVVLYCTIVTWLAFFVIRMIYKGMNTLTSELLMLIAILFVSFLIPNGTVPHIHYFKAMFPLFIIGYGQSSIKFFDKCKPFAKSLAIICTLTYLGISLIYQGKWSFYYFGLTPMPNLAYYYVLMILVAMFGIVALYYLCDYYLKYRSDKSKFGNKIVKAITELGSYTLAIYMIQGVLMAVLNCYKDEIRITSNWANYTVSIVLSVVFMIFIYYMIQLVSKSEFLSRYLLGKAKKQAA